MQLCNPLVIAAEKCGEILCQVLLVELGQGTDDAEIERNVAAEGFRRDTDLDVAGMHVRMEETITKHLGEKQRHAVTCQLGNVDSGSPQTIHLADRDAAHALHHDDFGPADDPPG